MHSPEEERLLSFHVGQVRESPRGTLYRVASVERGGYAVLRLGIDGKGRRVARGWSDVLRGWTLHSDTRIVAASAQEESGKVRDAI